MNNITERIAALSEEQRELLRRRLKGQSADLSRDPIVPVSRGKEFIPLSFSQQRLWFIEQFEPGNTMYNCPIAARLVGDLDVDALQRTISEIVRRHEILRTAFITGDGLPAQVVLPA